MDGSQDPRKLTRLLLDSGVATGASYLESDVPVLSTESRKLEQTLLSCQRLIAFLEALESQDSSMWRLFKSSPRYFLLVLFWILPRAYVTKIRTKSSGKKEGVEDEEDGHKSTLTMMRDTETLILQSVESEQVTIGLRNAIDHQILASDYLDSDPFVRIHLRSLYVDSKLSTVNDWEELTECLALLTLYRNGSAILTIMVPQLATTSIDETVRLNTSQGQEIGEIRIAHPIAEAYARSEGATVSKLVGDHINEKREGTSWWSLPSPSSGSLSDEEQTPCLDDAVRMYIGALGQVLGGFNQWMCYSTLTASTRCRCTATQGLQNHSQDLVKILTRSHKDESSFQEKYLNEALRSPLVSDHESLMATGGSALYLAWRDQDRSLELNFDVSLVTPIELSLASAWQLRMLDRATSDSRISRKALSEVQYDLGVGLAEHGRAIFTSERASEIYDFVDEKMKSTRTHERLQVKVGQLDMLFQYNQARFASRRGLAATIFSAALVALFGLPALSSSVNLAEASSTRLASWIFRAGGATQVSVYLYLVCLLTTALIAVWLFRSTLNVGRRRSKSRYGYVWTRPLSVVSFGSFGRARD